MPIEVQKNPPASLLAQMGVERWPIVTPDGGAPVSFGKGDLVVFPAGLSCTWEIRAAVRKHYRFG